MAIQLRAETALVSDDRNLLISHETRITQNANAISLLANQTQIDEITGELSTLQAELLVQANAISTKVSQTDYTGNTIASKINQTATTIKLKASKIELEGIVTANSRFKILLDGSMEAVNGKFSGTINGADGIFTGELNIPAYGSNYGLRLWQGTLQIKNSLNNTLLSVNQLLHNDGGVDFIGIGFYGYQVIALSTSGPNPTGITFLNNGNVTIESSGLTRTSSGDFKTGNITPYASNAYDLGAFTPNTLRWRTIYLMNNPNVGSDIRFKNNVEHVEDDFDDLILNTKIITYELENNQDRKIGINANEFYEQFKEKSKYIVSKSKDGYFGADYVSFVPMLIKTVQKLHKRVSELEN